MSGTWLRGLLVLVIEVSMAKARVVVFDLEGTDETVSRAIAGVLERIGPQQHVAVAAPEPVLQLPPAADPVAPAAPEKQLRAPQRRKAVRPAKPQATPGAARESSADKHPS